MITFHTPATLEYLRVIDVPDLIRLGSRQDGGYVVLRSCVIETLDAPCNPDKDEIYIPAI
ncbi:hypothetical protein MCBRY_000826 [Methylocystis bryophila]